MRGWGTLLVVGAILFACPTHANETESSRPSYSYAKSIEQMRAGIVHEIETSFVFHNETEVLKSAISQYKRLLHSACEEMIEAYEQTYLVFPPEFSTAKFHKKESRFATFLEQSLQQLLKMRRLIDQRKLRSKDLDYFLSLMEAYTNQVQPELAPSEHLQTVLPLKKRRLEVLMRLTISLLKAPWRVDFLGWVGRFLKPKDFGLKAEELEPRMIDQIKLNRHKGPGVHLFLVNHESGLLEVLLASRVFKKLDVQKRFIITFRRAFGAASGSLYESKSAVFVEDGDPLGEMEGRLIESYSQNPDQALGLIMAPEGMLPSASAFNPTSAKAGALILARRLAAKGVPVKIWLGHFNGLSFLSDEETDFQFVLQGPELVPGEKLQKPDAWVNHFRLQMEAFFNADRGTRHIDLASAQKVRSTDIPQSCAQALLE